MICENCGSVVMVEEATFCIKCHHPLNKGSTENDSASKPERENTESGENPVEETPPQKDTEERIDVADPIDFIMTPGYAIEDTSMDPPPPPAPAYDKQADPQPAAESRAESNDDLIDREASTGSSFVPEPPQEPPPEEPRQEPSEGPTAEEHHPEPSDEPASEFPHQEQPREPQPETAYQEQPDKPQPVIRHHEAPVEARQEVHHGEPQKAERFEHGSQNSNSFESFPDDLRGGIDHAATKKVMVKELERPARPQFPKVNVTRPAPEKVIPPANLPNVNRSKGLILLSGDTLTLTGGVKVLPGDEILIGDRVFEVRPKLRDKKKLIEIVGGAALALAIILTIFGILISGGDGRLIGVVLSDSGGYPLSGIQVRLGENNKTTTTNQSGFFIFDDLKSGLYTVQILENGTPMTSEKIAVVDGQVTTLTLYESSPVSSANERKPSKPVVVQTKKTPTVTPAVPAEPEVDYGTVNLTISPKSARSYLDGKHLGTGSGSYHVKPGKYVLSVKNDGYDSKSRNITVSSGRSQDLELALSKSKSAAKKKGDSELAYDYEASGNYSEAIRYYDKVLSRNPQNISAIMGKARCYRAQGLSDQAVPLFSQAAGLAGNRGDPATQIAALTSIIEMRPNTMTAYSTRGDLYYSRKEYMKAAADYEKVVQIDRRNLGTIYKLGNSYYYGHDYTNALSAFKAAEELNFADPKAYVSEAKTYLKLGDQKSMKKAYEKCKEYSSYSARLEFKNDPDWLKVLDALGVQE